MKAGTRLRLLADEEEVQPGIRVFWAGVHHRSSMAVAIDTEKGTVIITDCFFKYGNIESGRYLGVMESMMEADATWARIRKEAAISRRSTIPRCSFAIRMGSWPEGARPLTGADWPRESPNLEIH